jgi:hypothetical protein
MFVMAVESFGPELAMFLASKFHWKCLRPQKELRAFLKHRKKKTDHATGVCPMQRPQLARRKTKNKQSSPVGYKTCKTSSSSAALPMNALEGTSSKAILSTSQPRKSNDSVFADEVTATSPLLSTKPTEPSKCPCNGDDIPSRAPQKMRTNTLDDFDFQVLKRSTEFSRDSIVFLEVAKQFNFQLASRLASRFHWKLRPSLKKLRTILETI